MNSHNKAKDIIDVLDAQHLLNKELLEELKSVRDILDFRIKHLEAMIKAHEQIDANLTPIIPPEIYKRPLNS